VQVTSTRFGAVDIRDEHLFTFTDGIPGFPAFQNAALVEVSATEHFKDLEGTEGLFYLQSTTDEDLAFMCVDPFWAIEGYEVDFDEKALGIESPADALVLAIITLAEGSATTANLKAPIVVNTNTRVATQIVLDDPRWTTRSPLGV
jgi:flagellar assembly factor FliW